jgi:hypothetical protein
VHCPSFALPRWSVPVISSGSLVPSQRPPVQAITVAKAIPAKATITTVMPAVAISTATLLLKASLPLAGHYGHGPRTTLLSLYGSAPNSGKQQH